MLVRPKRQFPGTAFMLRGSALAHVWPHLVIIVGVSTVLTVQYEAWGLDAWTLTTIPFSLVGLALSIFLGFRNNACYDRWWEARKLWGRLINTSRSIARQTLTLVHDDAQAAEVRAFQEQQVERVIAYVHSLRLHLRREGTAASYGAVLHATDADLSADRNVPVSVLQSLGLGYRTAWKRGWIDTLHLPVLEESLTVLTDIQGGCERIKNTPVPLSYTVLTHRIVAMYCFALPFGIVAQVHDLTPLVVFIVAFAFLGLDSVGTQIEDPFETDPNDLPLLAISTGIESDLRVSLGREPLPDIQPERGVLL